MRRPAAVLLCGLAAAPAAAAASPLLLGAAAGGGYDSNLSESSGSIPVVGAGFATARAWAGAALSPSLDDDISLELAYDGTFYPTVPDLTEHRPSATVGWIHAFGDRLSMRLAPSAGLRRLGDPARNGWDAGGTASLRWRMLDPLALRIGAGYTHRAANDPAFAWSSGRGKVGLELDLTRSTWIAVSYTIDIGQDTFYTAYTAATPAALAVAPRSGAAGSPSGGTGGTGSSSGTGQGGPIGPGGRYAVPVSTFGGEVIAYSANRTAHTVSAALFQELPGGFHLQVAYAFTDVRGEYQTYRAHLFTGEVGWRL